MQYLVSVIATGDEPTPEGEMAAIGAFNDRLRADGHLLYANGLGDPSTATVVDNRGERPIVTDGPFLESKEYLAGFWILEAPDLDTVLGLASGASEVCNRRIEVRPLHGPDDR